MKKQTYSRKTMISQLAIICIIAFSLYLLLIIDDSDYNSYKNGIKYILYVFDFGINITIIINNDFQGSILLLYIMKMICLIGLDQTIFNIAFYVPIIAYYTYKALCFIQIRQFNVQIIKNTAINTNKKEQQQEEQIKKRIINFSSLIFVILIILSYLTSYSYDFTPPAIFIPFLFTFIYQVYFIGHCEQIQSKMISNSIIYNLYLYILGSLLLSRMLYGSFFFHLTPISIFLTFFFFFSRIYIGCYSDKFHSGDRYIFQVTYLFRKRQDFSYFKTLNNEKILRLLDNISRQVGLIIYLLGFLQLLLSQRYFFFLLGLYLINKFQSQIIPSFLIISKWHIVKDKAYNFHFTIFFPLLASIIYVIFLTQNDQVQILFDLINQCSNFHQQFIILTIIMTTISLGIQFISDNHQQTLINILQFSCPALIFFCIYNLQCLNINLLIILLYNLSLCFVSIRNMRWNEQNNEKQY